MGYALFIGFEYAGISALDPAREGVDLSEKEIVLNLPPPALQLLPRRSFYINRAAGHARDPGTLQRFVKWKRFAFRFCGHDDLPCEK